MALGCASKLAPPAGGAATPSEHHPDLAGDPPNCADRPPTTAPPLESVLEPRLQATLEERPGVLHVVIERAAIELEARNSLTGENYTGSRLTALLGCRCAEWDPEFAQITDAALPFDHLAVQLSSEPFCGGGSYSDAHLRVYVLDGAVDELARSIRAEGTAAIAELVPAELPVTRYQHEDGTWVEEQLYDAAPDPRWRSETPPEWTKVEFAYPRFYGDYGGTALIDVYLRAFGDVTVAVAVLHAGPLVLYFDEEKVDPIADLLRSVRRR